MKSIWIVRTLYGNPLDQSRKPERATALASYLADQGYQVTFWGTAFDHVNKDYLFRKTTRVSVKKNEEAVFLYSSIVYKRNLSPNRYLYSEKIAKNLAEEIEKTEQYPVPDVVLCAWPTEQDCRVMARYGKKHGVPVIFDARDRWPDIFGNAFPKRIRWLADFVLKPLKIRAGRTFSLADALFAMSPVMLDWALAYAGRDRTESDQVFYISSKRQEISSDADDLDMEWLGKEGVTAQTWNVCMFSSLRRTKYFDIDTVIEAIKKVHDAYPDVHLIIGGRGDGEDYISNLVKNMPYVHLAGWLDERQMAAVMSISKAGLYANISGWGNQVGQFFSYGLPLVTSSKGVADIYIGRYDCGLSYEYGDADGLAEQLIYLIRHPDRQREMSGNAYARFREDFEYEKVHERMKTGIDKVVQNYHNGKEKGTENG